MTHVSLKKFHLTKKNYQNLPLTCRFTWMTLVGCVETWHSYNPSSLLVAFVIFRRQLFGYWKSMVNRFSLVYVCWPTVNSSKPLSMSIFSCRFTQETYGIYTYRIKSLHLWNVICNEELNNKSEHMGLTLWTTYNVLLYGTVYTVHG